MTITFQEARREQVKLRAAILGVAGAGKTRGALEIASNLFGGGLKIFGIDSEHGRMKLYADRYRFQHGELDDDQSPGAWINAMDRAEGAGAEVMILDSVTHEWNGKGGILSMADKFGDWKTVRPKHTEFVERILSSQAHVIVCIRAKMEYAVNEVPDTRPNRTGTRQVIEKLGLGPVQDGQFLYEFDVVGDVDLATHEATFSNRCDPLVGRTMPLGEDVAEILTTWLSSGDAPVLPEAASENEVAKLRGLLERSGITDERIDSGFAAAKAKNKGVLTAEYVEDQTAKMEEKLRQKSEQAKEETATP